MCARAPNRGWAFGSAASCCSAPAEVGQRVKAGPLLAQLDGSDLALASQAAQAQVSAAQTQRDLAAADLKRFTDLKSQGFVSGAEIERRQATLQAAEAGLRQAQAQGSVQGNQAGYARLLADGPGVVVAVEAEVGQVVAAGSPVVRVARDGARDVVFAVPEDRLAQLRPGLVAQVRLWAAQAGSPGGSAGQPLSGRGSRDRRCGRFADAHLPGAAGAAGWRQRAAGRHRLCDAAGAQRRGGPGDQTAHQRPDARRGARPLGQRGLGVRRRPAARCSRARWWWPVPTATRR